MTTLERLKAALEALNERTDISDATRLVHLEKLNSATALYEERADIQRQLIKNYRSGVGPTGNIELILDSARKHERVERSLNFIFDMLGGKQ